MLDIIYLLLVQVNRDVNRQIKPMADMQQYGRELAVIEPPSGYGDCEDYALTKLHRLAPYKTGARLKIVLSETGQWHAVIIVGKYVLDNRFNELMTINKLERKYGYKFNW